MTSSGGEVAELGRREPTRREQVAWVAAELERALREGVHGNLVVDLRAGRVEQARVNETRLPPWKGEGG